MKKKLLTTLILSISCMLSTIFNSQYVSASEPINSFKNSSGSSLAKSGSNYATIILQNNQASASQIVYMGFNPTVTVRATGNPNMIYKVWVVNPLGVTGTVGFVKANGSTISKNLYLSPGGSYHVHVQPWSGTTNGQNITFNLSVTW